LQNVTGKVLVALLTISWTDSRETWI